MVARNSMGNSDVSAIKVIDTHTHTCTHTRVLSHFQTYTASAVTLLGGFKLGAFNPVAIDVYRGGAASVDRVITSAGPGKVTYTRGPYVPTRTRTHMQMHSHTHTHTHTRAGFETKGNTRTHAHSRTHTGNGESSDVGQVVAFA